MNKLTFLLLFVMSFFLTSCLDVVEEVYLNRDGSGKYSVTIDMSQLFADDFMKSMIQSSLEQDSTLNIGSGGIPEMDTLIYFKDLPADQKGSNPDFWNKVTSRIVMSEDESKFFTAINLNFDKASDITYLYDNLNNIGQSNAQLGGLTGEGGVLPSGVAYALVKNVLTRKSSKPEAASAGEEAEMMKMFLESATHRTIYHLPGGVKKVTIPGAIVNGKTVTVEASLVDVIEGNAKLDGSIKFK